MGKICDICRNEKHTRYFARKNKNICASCYEEYFSVKYKCDVCGEYNFIKSRKTGLVICYKCYRVLSNKDIRKRPLRLCYKCGEVKKAAKRIKNGHICHHCYEAPKKKCSKCGKSKKVRKYINKNPICDSCYDPPKQKCSICGEFNYIKKIDKDKLICYKCYKYPQIKCFLCDHIDRAYKLVDGKPICRRCYDKERLGIETHRLIGVLRKRLRDAFRQYSTNGKVSKATEYGIDYEKIIKHLGPCPGNSKLYQIDHILPLSAFDFNNPDQIRAAFAPENHQWLKIKENLIKGSKYDKKVLQQYLNDY